LALKKQFPNADVRGLDVSEKAVVIAKENAEKNRLNVDFFVADIFSYKIDLRFDIIVSNPPYVLNSEKPQMQANVLDYEPHQALFVDDENPLIFYTAIVDFAKQHLNPNGKLYFEINEKFGNEIAEMLENKGFSSIEIGKDFRGKDRFVGARHASPLHY
jgi:release factor glutamine methyltransferase